MASKQRRQSSSSNPGIGLLFAPIKTYEQRVWQAAYDTAVRSGQSPTDAKAYADDALRTAKAMAKAQSALTDADRDAAPPADEAQP